MTRWMAGVSDTWLADSPCVWVCECVSPSDSRLARGSLYKSLSLEVSFPVSLNQYEPPGIQMLLLYFGKKQTYGKFRSLVQEIRITTELPLSISLYLPRFVLNFRGYRWHTSGVSRAKFWNILGARKFNIAKENESSSWALIMGLAG
jgi:hypothetical protein